MLCVLLYMKVYMVVEEEDMEVAETVETLVVPGKKINHSFRYKSCEIVAVV